jgi:hypothetical protein
MNLLGNEFFELSYERLWNFPLEALQDLARFFSVPWNSDDINLAIEANRADVMESGGTPIPVYGEVAERSGTVAKLPRGFVRKAKPNGWKSELSMRQKFKVWRVTRKTMAKAGYEWSPTDWL